VFLGFLVGTKYTMVAVAMLVPVMLLVERRSFAPGKGSVLVGWLTNSLVVGCVALAVASPWFVKNAVFTGNPVYPLAWGVFDGGEWNEELTEFYLAKSGQKGFHPRYDESLAMTLRHLLITPWTATIYWRLDPAAGHPGYEDFFLGPVFLLWLPLLLRVLMVVKHRSWRQTPFRILVWFLAGYGLLWYFTYQSNRMLIPALGILSVLVVWSIHAVGRTGQWLAAGATAVLLGASVYNVEWSAEWVFRPTTTKPSAIAYVAGLESRDNYIRRAFEPYVMYRLMAQRVPKGKEVLFVGEYRPYHCPVAWRSSDWFDLPLILHLIRETADSDALLDRLRDEGTEYIFCNRRELARLKPRYFTGLALDYPDQGPEGSMKVLAFPPLFSEAERVRFEELFGAIEPVDNRATPAVHTRLYSVLTLAGMELYRIDRRAEEESGGSGS
jgi:hypothetical protein